MGIGVALAGLAGTIGGTVAGAASFLPSFSIIAGAVSVGSLLLSAGSQVAGGFAAQEASREQVRATREETAAAKIESAKKTKQLKSRQLVNFLKSGVRLEGTPLAILEETEKLGAQDIEALEKQEQSQIRKFQSQGRTALLSGISGSTRSLATAAQTFGRL